MARGKGKGRAPASSAAAAEMDVDASPETVFAPGFLTDGPGTLAARLRALQNVLFEMDQLPDDASRAFLAPVASDLMDKSVRAHKDRMMRLYAACCLSDVLRVCVPESPFDEDQLLDVFELFVAQLAGLESTRDNDDTFIKAFYLLERLAVVKAFVIPIQLGDAGIDLVNRLFTLFFDIVSDAHSHNTKEGMKEIMSTVLIEFDEIPQSVLDGILVHLTADGKARNGAAYELARGVIQTCSTLQQFIHRTDRFLLSLVEPSTGLGAADGAADDASELGGHLHELVLELYQISPSTVVQVIPKLTDDLRLDDTASRLATVRLFASLFKENGQRLAENYRDLLPSFLDRLKDQSRDVRLEVLATVRELLATMTEHRGEISTAIGSRLLDPDEKVRAAAVAALCDASVQSLSAVTLGVFVQVGERLRDKKVAVRLAAVRGLAAVYHAATAAWGLPRTWPSASARESGLDLAVRVGWVPAKMLGAYYLPDSTADVRAAVLKALADDLLPSLKTLAVGGSAGDEAAETYVAAAVDLVAGLGEKERKVLDKMMADATQFRADLARLVVQTRRKSKLGKGKGKANVDERAAVQAEQIRVQKSLANRLASTADAVRQADAALGELVQAPATDVQRALDVLVDDAAVHKASFDDVLKAQAKLVGAFSRERGKDIARSAILHAFTPLMASPVFAAGIETVQTSSTPSTVLLELLQMVSAHRPDAVSPDAFRGLVDHLVGLVDADVAGDDAGTAEVVATIRIMHNCASCVPDAQAAKAVKYFAKLATDGPAECAGRAVHAYVAFAGTDAVAKALGTKLTSAAALAAAQKAAADNGTDEALTSTMFALRAMLKSGALQTLPAATVAFLTAALDGFQNEPVRGAARSAGARAETKRRASLVAAYAAHVGGMEKEKLAAVDTQPVVDVLASEKQPTGVRLAAAKALLRLARNPAIEALITPAAFQQLAAGASFADVDARQDFHRAVYKGLVCHALPLRYMALQALFAAESDRTLHATAKEALLRVVAHRRRFGDAQKDQDPKLASYVLPEYALPYVLTTIAHCEWMEDDAPAFRHSARVVNFFLDAILHGNDTFAFLVQIIATVQRTRDARAADEQDETTALWRMCELTMNLVKARAEKKSYKLRSFPGQIFISRVYFKPLAANEAGPPAKMLEAFGSPKKRMSTGSARGSAKSTKTAKRWNEDEDESSEEEDEDASEVIRRPDADRRASRAGRDSLVDATSPSKRKGAPVDKENPGGIAATPPRSKRAPAAAPALAEATNASTRASRRR